MMPSPHQHPLKPTIKLRLPPIKLRLPREPFSGLSHGAGAALAIAGLIILLVLARGRVRETVAFACYGASLVLLYTVSALYHSLRTSPRGLSRWQRMDHAAIYGLIAGSYVPVCVLALRGVVGWGLLAAELGLAAVGIGAVLLWRRAPEWFRVVLYLLMGWLVVAALGPLRNALPPAAFAWMMAGGVTYSVGAVVFAADRPHLWPGRFSAHDLWHLFVLGGSTCHFVVMLHLAAVPGA